MNTGENRRGELAARLPGHVVLGAHVGKDSQASGEGPLAQLGSWAAGRRLAVAGGLTAADLAGLASREGAVRAIVGSAVTRAADPVAAVAALLDATQGGAR